MIQLSYKSRCDTIPAQYLRYLAPEHINFHLDNEYNHGYTKSMKTAISIPDKIFTLAENLAKQLEMSRSELYSRAIERYVRNHLDESVTETLNAIYDTEDSSLDLTLARIQTSSLSENEW